jgi:hypothetical protein
LHLGLEQDVPILAGVLGCIEGEVGVAQQFVGGALTADGDADRHAHRHGLAGAREFDRLAEHFDEAIGDHLWRRFVCRGLQQRHELVTAEAADRVLLTYGCRQAIADRLEYLIAGGMSVAVVNVLEAVDVDEKRGDDGRMAYRPRQHPLGTIHHKSPVGQSGQHVVQRHRLDLAERPEGAQNGGDEGETGEGHGHRRHLDGRSGHEHEKRWEGEHDGKRDRGGLALLRGRRPFLLPGGQPDERQRDQIAGIDEIAGVIAAPGHHCEVTRVSDGEHEQLEKSTPRLRSAAFRRWRAGSNSFNSTFAWACNGIAGPPVAC